MQRILVTGGAGFLGSHLCRRLILEGHEVICLDNVQTGHRENVRDLLGSGRFQFVKHDITEPFDYQVDAIYNFACPASPPHYQADAIKTLKTSVYGMINCLELAKKYKARVLLASTSEVYGDPLVHPQVEDYRGNVNPIGPRACYDEGKRCAETLCFDYWRQHKVDIRIIRIFNTYGPGMDPKDGRVVSNFIVQALKAESLTVYGDGRQTRSFCFVDDLIEGIVRAMVQEKVLGPINLGNPHEFTVGELAEKVLKVTGSVSRVVEKELPEDDPKQRCPDITLAKKVLSWEPQVALEEGLMRSVPYFRERLGL